MAKYSGKSASSTTRGRTPSAPVSTTDERVATYNGDPSFARDAKSELFVLAVNFMGEQENTFYETGSDRQSRFVALLHQVTQQDAKWMQKFIPFLRNDAYMRTASVVAAVEYVRAGGPEGASVVDSAIKRGDEPAELLGYYWASNGGRKTLAKQVRLGLAQAANRLFTEFNSLKYDGTSRGIRFADVLEVTHPKATSPEQNWLFQYLLDQRHHGDWSHMAMAEALPMVAANRSMRTIEPEKRREYLRAHPDALRQAGFTWESVSEWLGKGSMDAEAWEAMIPTMGYMALLRNLRNFDEAGVSDETAARLSMHLSEPQQVAKSMQFPYRFYTAYKNTNSTRWAHALDRALDLSTSNIPKLKGRSLVLIDVSGSMTTPMSGRSTMQMCEAAGVFGVAQFRAAGFEGNIVVFGESSADITMRKGTSVLKGTALAMQNHGVGHSTNLWPALTRHYAGHDRVFCFTDMQANYAGVKPHLNVPVYFWNLAGYRPAATVGSNGVYEMGGLSDVTFRQIALLEASKDASWPWEM